MNKVQLPSYRGDDDQRPSQIINDYSSNTGSKESTQRITMALKNQ